MTLKEAQAELMALRSAGRISTFMIRCELWCHATPSESLEWEVSIWDAAKTLDHEMLKGRTLAAAMEAVRRHLEPAPAVDLDQADLSLTA